MIIANSNSCHDVIDWNTTLLTVVMEEATLAYEKLFLLAQKDMFDAIVGERNRLVATISHVAFFHGSFESKIENC